MRHSQKNGYVLGSIVICIVSLLLLPMIVDFGKGGYYDNTTITVFLNVSNVAPYVSNVVIHDNDTLSGSSGIILRQGTTDLVYCNATINDNNGYQDIKSFNATLFHSSAKINYSDDNNYHYTNVTCINSTINITALAIQCKFNVWFYANNGTWNCTIAASDIENASNSSSGTRTIEPLYALDLNRSLIDYGELSPGSASTDDTPVRITNFGNMNINISVEGYATDLHDGLSMDCTTGNISVHHEKYAVEPGLTTNTMQNLSTNPLLNGISGLTVVQNTDDSGNSTNNTYWKFEVPIGTGSKGRCNGTVLFSALGPV